MSLAETIQDANKAKNLVIGYRESRKFLKLNDAKLIVVARNSPEKMKKEMEHNARISRVKVEEFEGSSKELGVLCGKPYPVCVLVVK